MKKKKRYISILLIFICVEFGFSNSKSEEYNIQFNWCEGSSFLYLEGRLMYSLKNLENTGWPLIYSYDCFIDYLKSQRINSQQEYFINVKSEKNTVLFKLFDNDKEVMKVEYTFDNKNCWKKYEKSFKYYRIVIDNYGNYFTEKYFYKEVLFHKTKYNIKNMTNQNLYTKKGYGYNEIIKIYTYYQTIYNL